MRTRRFLATTSYALALGAVLIMLPWVGMAAASRTLDQQFVAAAAYGDLVKVRTLLKKGADINAGNGTALIVSARRGHVEMVRFLLKQGIDQSATSLYAIHPHNPTRYEWEEPHIYSKSEVEAIARWRALSKEQQRDVLRLTAIGTALIQAARRGYADVVRAILNMGVEPEEAGFAMKWAALEGHMGIAKLLLERGAAVDARSHDGRTALMEFSRTGRSNVVRMLLDGGADAGLQDEYGASALTLAAEAEHAMVVQMLVDSGANVNSQDCFGLTALMRAAKKGDASVAKILFEKGANLELKSMYGWTALGWAAFQGSPEVVKALVTHGADLNVKTQHGWTPLMLAAFKGHADVVSLLMVKGAFAHSRNARGWTALDYAQAANQWRISELLRKHYLGE